MAQEPALIEQHIRETRERLDDDVAELQQRVRSQLDWRQQLERHPWTATLGAFGAGLIVSLWMTRSVLRWRT